MYLEAIFRMPEAISNPILASLDGSGENARRAIARLSGDAGDPLPRIVYNYGVSGPLSGSPPIRFRHCAGGLRLQGVGPRGAQMMVDHAPTVRDLLVKAVDGFPVQVSVSEGECKAQIDADDHYYVVDGFVFQRKSKRMEAWWREHGRPLLSGNRDAAHLESLTVELEREFVNSIATQCRDLLPQSDDVDPGLRVGLTDGITAKVTGLRSLHAIDVRRKGRGPAGHATVCAMNARCVTIRTNLLLSGPWQVGRLVGRGFGTVTPIKFDASRSA